MVSDHEPSFTPAINKRSHYLHSAHIAIGSKYANRWAELADLSFKGNVKQCCCMGLRNSML